jgi:uncharacterized protein YbaR (Trm112 family)
MQKKILNMFACPQCGGNINIKAIDKESDGAIKDGGLFCISCKSEFPIKNYIHGLFLLKIMQNHSVSSGTSMQERRLTNSVA